jgi:hypothetical protein
LRTHYAPPLYGHSPCLERVGPRQEERKREPVPMAQQTPTM